MLLTITTAPTARQMMSPANWERIYGEGVMTTLVPAYGRDYKSIKEVKAAWDEGKDFLIQDIHDPNSGRYVNKPQVPGRSFNIRYSKLMKVVIVKG